MTGEPGWSPGPELVEDLRAVLASAPLDTPEQRFDAWTYRALLAEHGAALLTRACEPAHVTASAVVLSEDGSHTCLVLHGRTGQWVQPGGHLESGDTGLAAAAAREVAEETGLHGRVLDRIATLSRHRAPCRPAVVDWHLDVEFVLVTPRTAPQVSAESRDVAWWPVTALPPDSMPGVAAAVAAAGRVLVGR